MPITSVSKDPAALTMTVVAEFPVPVQRLWDAYSDPRQLEQFWGPPTYPARFTRHDMYPGGRSEYVMTGPEGDESRGYWEFLDVAPLESFEVRDGFANPDGAANVEMPSHADGVPLHRDRHRVAGQHHDLVQLRGGPRPADRHGHGAGHARGHGPDGRRAG